MWSDEPATSALPSPVPGPSPKRKSIALVVAFLAGVGTALLCVWVGFPFGRGAAPPRRPGADVHRPVLSKSQPISQPVPPGALESNTVDNSGVAQRMAQSLGASRSPQPAGNRIGGGNEAPAAAKAEPRRPSAPLAEEFVVGMAPVPTAEKAAELVAVLNRLGYRANTVGPQRSRPDGVSYVVQIGPYASRDDAQLALQKMKLEGLAAESVTARRPSQAVGVAQPFTAGGGDLPKASNTGSFTVRPPGRDSAGPLLPSPAVRGFVVQVEARQDRGGAQRVVNQLRSHGYPAYLTGPDQGSNLGALYRVQVGPYATASDAERVRRLLAGQGFRPFIRRSPRG